MHANRCPKTGRFVTTVKPLVVTEDSITVAPEAEAVPRLQLCAPIVEQTTATCYDLDGNVQVQDVYTNFPSALRDAIGYMDGEDFDLMRLGEVGPVLKMLVPDDVVKAPIGWDFFDTSVGETDLEAAAEMGSMVLAEAVLSSGVDPTVDPEDCPQCKGALDDCWSDDEPYAEMVVTGAEDICTTRDRRRDTYARAIAAVANMTEDQKTSKRVKSLLYIVESRTTDAATEVGLGQADRAADELCAMAAVA